MQEKVVKSPNISVIKKQHINKWVALSTDYKKLLAVGDSLSAVLKKTKQSNKIVIKVLPDLGYAPISR
ncbi:MAG: hypothetical protein A3C70_01050 [Candidatus Zambryskibacteria bacterium RIFCSPHIGHO2_02_FULL_43_14]|uniref:DUF5678 domain-containing protein n=1 Tax=Candidatus Zambryskibacteria bacterium RIFCSPHIGHO2_02_FULL_43_14 TaxID=1802748 RepID=A0A1G2TFH6_9BACT|nr:MAG: hypothetical protein A2829_00780 [Candidatus Zambryskibacteria bacterium RIFCSPHIGHO2_01_FULL_43_60]OHA95993.1 MAG: hypothetical protein A3C70_01050 [Candidatus Zambryskibacteria bacterium RIFCSPHIGHO2_02_FULL_43_14]OHB03121.1 MAG: hypothetical protein A3B03_01620 [Candidatus Zambryskibacteria bacterium RIFCSPLOWO2_01_FULL_42_41]